MQLDKALHPLGCNTHINTHAPKYEELQIATKSGSRRAQHRTAKQPTQSLHQGIVSSPPVKNVSSTMLYSAPVPTIWPQLWGILPVNRILKIKKNSKRGKKMSKKINGHGKIRSNQKGTGKKGSSIIQISIFLPLFKTKF